MYHSILIMIANSHLIVAPNVLLVISFYLTSIVEAHAHLVVSFYLISLVEPHANG